MDATTGAVDLNFHKSVPLLINTSMVNVKYEIRGPIADRAHELRAKGHKILECNTGNPGVFGFTVPEPIVEAIRNNLTRATSYVHQKGLGEAREAVLEHYKGIVTGPPISLDDIYIGNGASELITNAVKGLLNPGEEILVPAPDYPLWTAAVTMAGGVAKHYPCKPENNFIPTIQDIQALVTSRTRGIVVINPNNPTGAVYPEHLLRDIVTLAEGSPFGGMVVFADEIYDRCVYESNKHFPLSSMVTKTLCVTFNGLSKVYRACGFRVGWMVLSGDRSRAGEYRAMLDKLSALRLCSNVPPQWGVKPALTDPRCNDIAELCRPGGRLYEARRAVLEGCAASTYLEAVAPQGAMYVFPRIKIAGIDDKAFAMELLERKHILIVPGSGFNVPFKDHFRMTLLPQPDDIRRAFKEIDDVCKDIAMRKEKNP